MHTGALPDAHDVIYGDTLWSLAKRYRSDNSVSIQRMMLAMLSANPDAFNIQNINALRAGTVLQIPDLSQFGSADRQVVLAEVNRQHEIWQEYRQGLAGAAPQAPEGASAAAGESESATSASGSSQEPAATQAQAETEPAATDNDRLALVSGGQGTEGVGSATSDTASAAQTQQELNLAREEADAKTRQADELNSRVADLEGIVEELQRAIQLRDDNIAALQEMLAKVELEASELRAAAEQAEAQAAAAGAGTETAPEPMVTPPPEPVVEAPPEPVVEAPPEPVVEAPPEPVVEAPPEPVVEAPPEPVVEAPPEPVVEAPPEPVVAVAPEPEPPKLLPPPPPPPSFIDSLLESLPVDPVLLGAGLGGLLVVLGGAALWRRRRTSEEAEDMGELDVGALDDSDLLYDEDGEPYLPDDVGDATGISDLQGTDLSGEQAEPQAQVEELDAPDSTGIAVAESAAGSDDSEDDPLTEVNVYLAYERYDQAEELVRSAIGQYPDRHEYKLRLLEVFYAAKDLGNFESSARELQDAVGADNQLLSEARKMWQDMSPGRELFSEAESTVPEDQDVLFDVTGGDADSPATVPGSSLGGTDDSSSVDFDLGFEAPATAEGDAGSGESSLDFDLGFDQAAGDGAQEESGLDLDLTSIGGDSEYVGADAGAGGGSGVDFDLGAGDAPAAEDDSGSSSMDFDLTGMDSSAGQSGGPSTETPLPERVSRDDDDMDFDLEGLGEGTLIDSQVPPEAPAGAVPEPLDTADADDGALDFDLDGIGGESAGVESGAMSMDAEFTALDLNLDTADAGAASSGSQLSALDDANSALGFDIGGDSVDAGAGESPDEDLDFGLELDDDGPTAGGDFNLSLEDDLDDEVSEETVKLDLNAALGGDDLADELDTVKLQTPEMDAADSAISDLGMDLNLDMDEPEGVESSTGVDTAFEGVFGDDAGAASDDDMALSLDGSDLVPSTPPPSADAEPEFPEIDLDFDAEKSQDAAASDEYESTQFMLRDMPASDSASAGSGEGHSGSTLMLGGGLTGEVDEVQTKLDLAQAYIDMGDTDGAKGIIDEVLAEGNASQKQAAMGLLGKLASS
jgi:pilus assembly protein FimV